MGQIQLTVTATGAKISLSDENIISVKTSGSGSEVVYSRDPQGFRYSAIVSEVAATIASASDTLILVTDQETAQSFYVNIKRIDLVDQSGTYVSFLYQDEGATDKKYLVTQTVTQLYDLIYGKQGKTTYAYDAISAVNETISLAAANGDVTAQFTNGVIFTVYGSSTAAMNTLWTVSSSTFSGGKTVITVTGNVPAGASATGTVVIN